MKSKETTYAYLKITEGILHCYYKPMKEVDLEIAKVGVKDRIDFCQHQDYPCLFDISNAGSMTKEARDYLANEGNDYVTASAIVVNSPVLRMIANFFIRISRPKNPTQMFSDKRMAVKWLSQYVSTKESDELNQAS